MIFELKDYTIVAIKVSESYISAQFDIECSVKSWAHMYTITNVITTSCVRGMMS